MWHFWRDASGWPNARPELQDAGTSRLLHVFCYCRSVAAGCAHIRSDAFLNKSIPDTYPAGIGTAITCNRLTPHIPLFGVHVSPMEIAVAHPLILYKSIAALIYFV